MAPPHVKRAAPAASGNGSQGNGWATTERDSSSSGAPAQDHQKLLAAFDLASDRLRDTTDTLEAILDWRDELLSRIRRAQLRFELLDCELDTSELEAEVAEFVCLCQRLAWRPKLERAAA